MADLARFSRNMLRRAEKIPGGVHKVVQGAAVAIDQALVSATPVDTGRARSNWIVAIDAPSDKVNPVLSPSEAIENARSVIKTSKIGSEIHLTNNLPYIGRLNEGSSAQAPANFVEEAVAAGIKQVNKSKILDN